MQTQNDIFSKMFLALVKLQELQFSGITFSTMNGFFERKNFLLFLPVCKDIHSKSALCWKTVLLVNVWLTDIESWIFTDSYLTWNFRTRSRDGRWNPIFLTIKRRLRSTSFKFSIFFFDWWSFLCSLN